MEFLWGFFPTGAKDDLGDDTVLVVTSDNGGANWFGGLNEPLRGGKKTFLQSFLKPSAGIPRFICQRHFINKKVGNQKN